jgi:hypothetical protein
VAGALVSGSQMLQVMPQGHNAILIAVQHAVQFSQITP